MASSTGGGASGAAAAQCPRCGRPLPQTRLGGLCPTCLMRQAFTGDRPQDDAGGARTEQAAQATSVAFTMDSPAGSGKSPTLISSSPSTSVWMLVALLADDEEFVTYLAREQALSSPSSSASSARLAQLLVRKQHVIPSELDDARQQLQRRCAALRRLRHSALAAVLDGGLTGDGHPFLVTAFVMAAPLVDLDAEGMDPDTTRYLLDQARSGLQALHGAGLAHGRVRASTVLARQTHGGATVVVTGYAPLDRFPILSDAIADDLEQFQRLTSTLRV